MHITYQPSTAEEAWSYIAYWHRGYHNHLKHFRYGFKQFIPNHPAIIEMYEQENLIDEQKSKYRDIFFTEIYNEKDLRKFDSLLADSAVPALQKVVDILTPMAKKWGIEFPNKVEIVTTYGKGGSYNYENPGITFRMTDYKPEFMTGLLQHEFIHLLIEIPIIKKYNVPQDLKERIVDIIGFEYFGKPVQSNFENSFANKYITIEAIENDLPKAVAQMMTDYAIFKAKQQTGKSQE